MSKPVVFEGRSAEMKKDSPWLASEDLQDLGDVKVIIEAVYRHADVEFDAGRKEKWVYSLKFQGKQKQLVLNSTNRKAIVGHYGTDVSKWKGKELTLYVDPDVRLMGKKVCGIRVR